MSTSNDDGNPCHFSRRLKTIESHTGGEPTRILVEGGPDLGSGALAERRALFERDYDWLRSAVVNEPRGSDAVVGGLLCPPHAENCDFGVLYFNNVSCLNMCIHGTIGLAVTLAHIGRLKAGDKARVDTVVGEVEVRLHENGREATVANVPSYRKAAGIEIEVPSYGRVKGDVAWGGNWFFLVEEHDLRVAFSEIPILTEFCRRARAALRDAGVTGDGGMEIDHIEVFATPDGVEADSRNFVYCPGGAYDRSPCGTGTSAKLACLHADGKLRPGQVWTQAGILGSAFTGWVEALDDGRVIPHITGSAFVNAETRLIIDPADPFRHGITPETIR